MFIYRVPNRSSGTLGSGLTCFHCISIIYDLSANERNGKIQNIQAHTHTNGISIRDATVFISDWIYGSVVLVALKERSDCSSALSTWSHFQPIWFPSLTLTSPVFIGTSSHGAHSTLAIGPAMDAKDLFHKSLQPVT